MCNSVFFYKVWNSLWPQDWEREGQSRFLVMQPNPNPRPKRGKGRVGMTNLCELIELLINCQLAILNKKKISNPSMFHLLVQVNLEPHLFDHHWVLTHLFWNPAILN